MTFFFRFVAVFTVFALAQSFPTAIDFENDSAVDADGRLDNMDERGDYFQGDILLDPSELHLIQQGLKDKSKRWPKGVVVYKITGSFSSDEKNTIKKAQDLITSKTCIRFKERTNENDYISVENSQSGCFSAIGRRGGKQTLNLGNGCVYKGIPAHEFIHALGFFHEQARTDRDDFVKIEWENIPDNKKSQFEKNSANSVDSYGATYDYGSIMHYGKYAFSKNNKPTITPKQNKEIGQRDALSGNDAKAINNMYENCK